MYFKDLGIELDVKPVKDKKKYKDDRKKAWEFKKEEYDKVMHMYSLGATDALIRRRYKMSQSQFKTWKDKHIDDIEQAKASKEMLILSKAYDIALNKDNVTMLKYIMTNELGWSERNENIEQSVQTVQIVDNSGDEIETVKNKLDKLIKEKDE